MKSKQGLLLFLVGAISGGWLAVCLFGLLQIAGCGKAEPPKLAGQPVPEHRFQIDFERRYDLILDSYRGQRSLDDCLIKGFTEEAKGGGGLGSSRSYGYFDSWLVVELPDGRLAYLPPRSVHIIEETGKPNKALPSDSVKSADGLPGAPEG